MGSQKQLSVRPHICGMAMNQNAHWFFASNLTQFQTSHSIHFDLLTQTASPTLVTPLVLPRSKNRVPRTILRVPRIILRVPRTLLLGATHFVDF